MQFSLGKPLLLDMPRMPVIRMVYYSSNRLRFR